MSQSTVSCDGASGLKYQVLRPLAEKRGLEPWEKIVNFTKDECFPSRLPFGKFEEGVR